MKNYHLCFICLIFLANNFLQISVCFLILCLPPLGEFFSSSSRHEVTLYYLKNTLLWVVFCRKASWFPPAMLSFPRGLMGVCMWCHLGARRVGSMSAPPPMLLATPKGKCSWPSMVRARGGMSFSYAVSVPKLTSLPDNVIRRLCPKVNYSPRFIFLFIF